MYVKTKTIVKRVLKEQLKHEFVKNVERNMNTLTEEDFSKQRDE